MLFSGDGHSALIVLILTGKRAHNVAVENGNLKSQCVFQVCLYRVN
jgi:hypothetical protein